MKKRTIAIILGLLIFFAGIVLLSLSALSRIALVPYQQILASYEGEDIPEAVMVGPFLAKKGGINISSCEGYNGEPLFRIRDSEDRLVYSSPPFPPSSYNIEYDISEPGYYSVYFNLIFRDDSYVSVYEYRERKGRIYPYENFYNIGLVVAVLGIVASAAGMFIPSKEEENEET